MSYLVTFNPLIAVKAFTNPTAKALEDPKPVFDGISANVENSIGKSILKYFNAS